MLGLLIFTNLLFADAGPEQELPDLPGICSPERLRTRINELSAQHRRLRNEFRSYRDSANKAFAALENKLATLERRFR